MIDSTLILSRRRFLSASAAISAYATLPSLALARADYQETSVTGGGMIKGTVTFKGSPPAPSEVLISKDNAHCGDGHVIPDPVSLAANGQVARAIVAIKDIPSGKAWPKEMGQAEIIQEKCKFLPYIQVAKKGVELNIINKDPLLHNIHAYELIGRARRNMFNIAQPAAGQIDTHTLKTRRSNLVEVDCDAHNWMSAWIYLSDHPYVVITDDRGQFTMDGIPPGQFKVVTWHPVLGKNEQEVTVAAKQSLTLDIAINL